NVRFIESAGDQNMKKYFMDLHVHIGRSSNGAPVKITTSRDLTFANIARECKYRKGIDIVGIVDCASPNVIDDISQLIKSAKGGSLNKNIASLIREVINCLKN
ncbi:unnamed protein product, partial [marine sediment metagenome]